MVFILPAAGYAMNALTVGSGSSKGVDDELFDHVLDDDEDVLVYSGEDYTAVVNQFGEVQTNDDDTFWLSDDEYRELSDIVSDEFGVYDDIVGLETDEEGKTNQHIYSGKAENYDGRIDVYTESEFRFDQVENILTEDQVEDMLEIDQGPRASYDAKAQKATV